MNPTEHLIEQLERLERENAELKADNARLRVNHLGVYTRPAAEVEYERAAYTDEQYVVVWDVNYLKQANDAYGQPKVNEMLAAAYAETRGEDVVFKFNIQSGDEYGAIIRGDPEGFIKHQTSALRSHGLDAIMAWLPLHPGDDLFAVCEQAMEQVTAAKHARGIQSR